MITLNEYLKDNALLYRPELTNEVLTNAQDLLLRVSKLLQQLKIPPPLISSGWRPRAKNTAVKGAKGSYHMIGKAVDFSDPKGILGYQIIQNSTLLEEHGLWMEHLQATPVWVHLDTGTRAQRNIRTFRPW